MVAACVPKVASSGVFRKRCFSGWVSLPFSGESKARGGCWPEEAIDVVTVVVLSSSADELGVNEEHPERPSWGDAAAFLLHAESTPRP